MRVAFVAALLLAFSVAPVHGQTRYWETSEVLGGGAYNVALRIPMLFAPKPYRGAIPRAVLFTLGSVLYECFLDHGHNMQDAVGEWTSTGQMQMDVKNRQIGYVLTEAVVLGVTWIVRRVK